MSAEVVAVVSYREDLLAAGLILGALIMAGNSLEARKPGAWLVGAAALSAAAAGAKMSAAPAFAVGTLTWALAPWRPPADLRRKFFEDATPDERVILERLPSELRPL